MTAHAALAPWASFFVITGSSAGALTGLMFVVITLVAGQERLRQEMRDGVETFSSPTVVHFCAALLISAILAAPWPRLSYAGIILGLTGLYGIWYAGRILRRFGRYRSRGASYLPGLDDWIWYAIVPLLAYAVVLLAGIFLTPYPAHALFALAAGVILLIFLGIRNAWDTVTYIAVENRDG